MDLVDEAAPIEFLQAGPSGRLAITIEQMDHFKLRVSLLIELVSLSNSPMAWTTRIVALIVRIDRSHGVTLACSSQSRLDSCLVGAVHATR